MEVFGLFLVCFWSVFGLFLVCFFVFFFHFSSIITPISGAIRCDNLLIALSFFVVNKKQRLNTTMELVYERSIFAIPSTWYHFHSITKSVYIFPEPRYWHHECYQQHFEASKGYCKGLSDKKDHLRKILISFNLWFKKRT